MLFIGTEKYNVSVFAPLVADMFFCVSCKFEIAIFKSVQVTAENVRFAFLYVLSILCKNHPHTVTCHRAEYIHCTISLVLGS